MRTIKEVNDAIAEAEAMVRRFDGQKTNLTTEQNRLSEIRGRYAVVLDGLRQEKIITETAETPAAGKDEEVNE